MTNYELADKARKIATEKKTLYVEGCFGSPLNAVNRTRYTRNHLFNSRPERVEKITKADAEVYGFSSSGLIKALCWGWNDIPSHTYGGAGYSINGIPDVNDDALIRKCKYVSEDMSMIQIGELVWTMGRVGIYIGNDQVVACDHLGKDGVQITSMDGLEGRKRWMCHGCLPCVEYLVS